MKKTDIERALRDLGWSLKRHGKKHDVWSKGEQEVTVPRHAEINEYTARGIIKDAKRRGT